MTNGFYVSILIMTFLISNAVMFWISMLCFSKKTQVGINLGRMISACNLVQWSFVFNYLFGSHEFKAVMVSLERIFLDFGIFFLTEYIFYMCEIKMRKELKILMFTLYVIDSALLITNPINHFVANVYYVNDGFTVAARLEPKFLFYVHVALCVLLLTPVSVTLVIKAVKTSRFYKFKYVSLVVLEMSVILFNTIYSLDKDVGLDFSVALYAPAIAFIYYATFVYKPVWLTRKFQEYTNEHIMDAIVFYDKDGRVLSHNERVDHIFEKKVWEDKDTLCEYLGNPEEGTAIQKVGDRYYKVNYTPMFDKNNGQYLGAVLIFHDNTETMNRLEREHRIATYDSLTDIYNRLGFFEASNNLLRTGRDKHGYVLMVSGIYNFKGINTSYGVAFGDEVLKTIAKRYTLYSKKYQTVYGRTAEAKFSCIIKRNKMDEFVNNMTSIPIAMEGGIEISVNMLHGFVNLDDPTKSLDFYYEEALMALANGKYMQRTPVVEYTQGMDEELKRRQSLISEMKSAIAKKEFFLELQPQIHLKEHRITGAEALVRWNHPTRGRIPPGEFISLFESNGFITDLDEFVWDEAAGIIKELNDEGSYMGHISVNVSQEDINNINVVEIFENIAKRHNLAPEKLHIEITESACADDRTKLIETMHGLREKGFLVEIDDFGSGYSSLNALMNLPFDIVKLDMLFMKNNKFDEKSETIVNAMTQMIHAIGATIIVEGVENDEIVNKAKKFEGDIAQGYFYSKPISVEEFKEFVKKFN